MKPAIINVFTDRTLLCLLLLLAVLLRLVLLLGNGEVVHQDGGEYFMSSSEVHGHLVRGDLTGLLHMQISGHWGGLLFGAIPFFLQTEFIAPERVSAIFFVLPQVVNIFLVFRLVLAWGFGSRAGLIAAFLYAFSFSTIYQARHVLLHDLALMFCLLSLLVIATATARSLYRIFAAGILAFFCMFTYYGYWVSSGIALLFAAGFQAQHFRHLVSGGLTAAAGFVLPLLLFYGTGRWVGVDLLDQFLHFSHSIQFGEFYEGHRIPFAFFYHAEGLLLFVWLVCLVALPRVSRSHSAQWLLLCIVLMYFMLVVTSNFMEYFVVYGRLARQLAPLLCMVAGVVLARTSLKLAIVVLVLIIPYYAMNYLALYQLEFDSEHARQRANILDTGVAADRQVREILVCTPHRDDKGFCEHIPPGCHELHRWLPYGNLGFLRYDGMKPGMRGQLEGVRVEMLLLACQEDG